MISLRSLRVSCASLGALVLLAGPVRADDDPSGTGELVELERGRLAYQAGRYDECARLLGEALGESGVRRLKDAEVIREARLYRAACLIGSGQDEDADAELTLAIQEGPTLDPPDQRVFPPELVQRYIQLRVGMQEELRAQEDRRRARELAAQREEEARRLREAQRVKALEKYAEVQSYTTVSSRWLAMVPFGVGQFQNRDYALGYTLLIAEGLLAGVTLTAVVLELSLHRDAVAAGARGETIDDVALSEDVRTLSNVATAAGWGFVGVSLLGVLQAQLGFVPSHTDVRYTPLPRGLTRARAAPLSVVPTAQVGVGGGSIGLSGRF